jgi:tetrahydromethanopterin S-methyltransferase subunit G
MFQKGHTCTGCSKSVTLDKVHILFDSDDIQEVKAYLQELKRRNAFKKGELEFVTADRL